MNRKKILIIGIHDAMGGIEQVIYDYVRRIVNFDDNNIEFSFTNMFEKIVYQDEYKSMNCKIHSVPDVKKSPIAYIRALIKTIKQEKIDIVHYNMLSAANIVPLIAAKLAGCKKIIAHSHTAGTVGIHKYILHYLNRFFIPIFATNLFTCSDKAAGFMFGRRNRKKSVLIRNAVDVKKFTYNPEARKRIRVELKIVDDAPIIGHVGRFAQQKNHPFLIEIFQAVTKKYDSAKLLLVGTGHMEPQIRELVTKYNLADKVIFYGVSAKVCELYSAMDVFVLPSLSEGLGMVGMEAQCNGLFVVASDVIPPQIDATGHVKWHSLSNDSPETWADTVLKCAANRTTEDTSKAIAAAGYDINTEAGVLARMYESK